MEKGAGLFLQNTIGITFDVISPHPVAITASEFISPRDDTFRCDITRSCFIQLALVSAESALATALRPESASLEIEIGVEKQKCEE